MRIITGLARGLTLKTPRDGNTRPTSDRVREAIFSSLGEAVVGVAVLDLYAGTGALGLEAVSRGARSVLFVERARGALAVLRENLAAVEQAAGVTGATSVRSRAVATELKRLANEGCRFGLILADPPYGTAAAQLLADPWLPGLLATGGRLVLESAKRDPLAVPDPWRLERAAVYGDTAVRFFRLA